MIFLPSLQGMLALAKKRIHQAVDRAKFYVSQYRIEQVFEEGEQVFLQVPSKYTSLSFRKCHKIYPRYCGPWKIIKKLTGVAYILELPPHHCCIHPMFCVSNLK